MEPESRKTTGSDWLGRYYTFGDISRVLIDQMHGQTPSRILDLGSGAGALSIAALQRWEDAEILTVDVDESAGIKLGAKLSNLPSCGKHRHVCADALSDHLPSLIASQAPEIDAAVCNPPFVVPKWRDGFAEILEDAGFNSCLPSVNNVDAALLFLAQNLRLIKDGSTVGIILPDTLVSGARYRNFRRQLVERYCVERAIRLPRHSFSKTDAQAHILIISKRKPTTDRTSLFRLDDSHKLSNGLQVNLDKAIDRLDYEYHAQSTTSHSVGFKYQLLSELGVTLKRGSHTSAQAKHAETPILHTSNIQLSDYGKWCDLSCFSFKSATQNLPGRELAIARPGDILIARVGRNLEHKVIGVKNGNPLITDCVLRLRAPALYRKKILTQLSSPIGSAWLASRAHGVGARIITHDDVLSFPLAL
ncbi:N-6 DNA methylase [Dechloromonas agitata]|uniref:N-6 DNA methylase n=1 Tax=Dechloromonas agitata TaxID=73030 RepID=UPI0004B57665|nr:N-6 DNA methylase [Dechloromonas agitata]